MTDNNSLSDAKKQYAKRATEKLSTVFSSPEFIAHITVDGVDANSGERFQQSFIIDERNPEFKEFLNSYGARLSAILLT